MKRYIKASTKRLPWKVVLGWDAGGPESGPIWKADEFLVYAPTKEAAIAEIVDEYVDNPDDYDGIDAYPADQEFIDEHASIVDDEYEMGMHKTWLEEPEVMYPFKEDIPWDKINFQKQFTSWKQVYDKFHEIGDDDEVYKFYKRAEGNPYFERAWIEWNRADTVNASYEIYKAYTDAETDELIDKQLVDVVDTRKEANNRVAELYDVFPDAAISIVRVSDISKMDSISSADTTSVGFSGIDGLIDDVLYDTWDNYKYDGYSANDIADMVYEHIVMIVTEMDDDGVYEEWASSIDRPRARSYVRKYVKQHYNDYEWED